MLGQASEVSNRLTAPGVANADGELRKILPHDPEVAYLVAEALNLPTGPGRTAGLGSPWL